MALLQYPIMSLPFLFLFSSFSLFFSPLPFCYSLFLSISLFPPSYTVLFNLFKTNIALLEVVPVTKMSGTGNDFLMIDNRFFLALFFSFFSSL